MRGGKDSEAVGRAEAWGYDGMGEADGQVRRRWPRVVNVKNNVLLTQLL